MSNSKGSWQLVPHGFNQANFTVGTSTKFDKGGEVVESTAPANQLRAATGHNVTTKRVWISAQA